MTNYIITFIEWYSTRNTREKILLMGLMCALIYAVFSLILFQPLEKKSTALRQTIADMRSQIESITVQTNAIKKIPQSPLFREWQQQNQALNKLQGQYKSLLHTSPAKQWQDVVSTLLQSQENIMLVQLKNSPETDFNPTGAIRIKTKLFQQKITAIVYANYFDTIQFLRRLEKVLPNLHWDSLKYEVAKYPIAKVEMEFSITYEKG